MAAMEIPNNTNPSSRAKNSGEPLTGSHGAVNPSNTPSDRRNGSASLAGGSSTVNPPNHKFAVGMSKMPQPNSAVTPGKPAIPVSPWTESGSNARVKPLPAAAMRK